MRSASDDDLLASYEFALPDRAIAQRPAAPRRAARMLVHERGSGATSHHQVADLPALLRRGDVLVVNDTRVLPARLFAHRRTGGRVELLAVSPMDEGAWACMVRPSSRIGVDEELDLTRRLDRATGPAVVIGARNDDGTRRVHSPVEPLEQLFEAWGELPLPPYISRPEGPVGEDSARYQTVYATHDGAIAAPTAGLHFDAPLLAALEDAGIEVARLTLHVGAGTFSPVRTERLSEHSMHEERYRVPVETARSVDACLAAGSRLVAVGTTSLRGLESWHRAGRPDDGAWRSTRLFLRPGAPPQLPAALLTNFHLPRSTLLALVASLIGRPALLALYAEALEADYRFYSYGDCSLLL